MNNAAKTHGCSEIGSPNPEVDRFPNNYRNRIPAWSAFMVSSVSETKGGVTIEGTWQGDSITSHRATITIHQGGQFALDLVYSVSVSNGASGSRAHDRLRKGDKYAKALIADLRPKIRSYLDWRQQQLVPVGQELAALERSVNAALVKLNKPG